MAGALIGDFNRQTVASYDGWQGRACLLIVAPSIVNPGMANLIAYSAIGDSNLVGAMELTGLRHSCLLPCHWRSQPPQ
jgi:hypothetical protein